MAKFKTAENSNSGERRVGPVKGSLICGLGATAAATTLFFGAGAANADKAWVPGACDPTGQGIRATAEAQGRFSPSDTVIQYPAGMGLHCGPTTAADSIANGGQQVVDFYYNRRHNGPVEVEGFSLGAGVTDWAGMEILRREGRMPSDLHLISVGDGWGASGIMNHPLADIAEIVTVPLGIPRDSDLYPVPGMTVRNDGDDAFGALGASGLNIPEAIDIGIGTMNGGHRVPHPAEPNTVVYKDGVRYESYGPDQGRLAQNIQNGPSNQEAPGNVPAGVFPDFNNPQPMGNMAPIAVAPSTESVTDFAASFVPSW